MEFLSPEEKRARTLKLFFGYSIAAVAVISTTVVLSFVLQGVDLFNRTVDTKNGLLFVDSKPVSAAISINGQDDKRTDARFVLPEGKYDLKLTADGYREWSKNIDVIGGQVRYHVYPKLIPVNINKSSKANYGEAPALYTQSLDRRWLVLSPTKTQAILHKYDLNRPDSGPIQINLPEAVINLQELSAASFEMVEWSSDSKNVLYKKSLPDGQIQYILINIDKPEESQNISKVFELNNTYKVTLKDQKFDKYYILDKNSGILRSATLKNGIEPKVYAENVFDYKYYANNIILYATTSGAADNEFSVRVIRDSDTYLLNPISRGDKALLDIAVYEGDWYYVAASNNSENVDVYFNPLDQTPNIVDGGVIKPQISLLVKNPIFIGFSDNTRFIAAEAKDEFSVYDGELNKKYRFKAPTDIPVSGAKWMDGHRFSFVSQGQVVMFEFDGKNKQDLVPGENGFRPYYDRDYLFMYNISKAENGEFSLQQSDLSLQD